MTRAWPWIPWCRCESAWLLGRGGGGRGMSGPFYHAYTRIRTKYSVHMHQLFLLLPGYSRGPCDRCLSLSPAPSLILDLVFRPGSATPTNAVILSVGSGDRRDCSVLQGRGSHTVGKRVRARLLYRTILHVSVHSRAFSPFPPIRKSASGNFCCADDVRRAYANK